MLVVSIPCGLKSLEILKTIIFEWFGFSAFIVLFGQFLPGKEQFLLSLRYNYPISKGSLSILKAFKLPLCTSPLLLGASSKV